MTQAGVAGSRDPAGFVYQREGQLLRQVNASYRASFERVLASERTQRHHAAPFDELPDGTFVLADGVPYLTLGTALLRWTPAGYTERHPRPRDEPAVVITPPSIVAVLRTGWRSALPLLHPSAR